jgi:hypothetical protein
MHLNVANVAHFLISRGLLSAESIVAGNLIVLDSSRRNRNFKIIRDGAPGLFIKQMRAAQPDAMMTLRREAALLRTRSRRPGAEQADAAADRLRSGSASLDR